MPIRPLASSTVGVRKISKAFTLIELLVVISIIALLISILLPALSSVREQAKITICATQTRGLAQALITQAVDNKGRFVRQYLSDNERIDILAHARRDELVEQYGVSPAYFYCPSNPEYKTAFGSHENWTDATGVSLGYVIPVGEAERINGAGIKYRYSSFKDAKDSGWEGPVIHETLEDVAWYDAVASDLTATWNLIPERTNSAGQMVSTMNHIKTNAVPGGGGILPEGDGGANTAFIDGHAKWLPRKELGTPAAGNGTYYRFYGGNLNGDGRKHYWF